MFLQKLLNGLRRITITKLINKNTENDNILYKNCIDFISSNKDIFPYTTENLQEILDFWLSTPCTTEQMDYRIPTTEEKLDYALIDYLACYRRAARDPYTISSHNFYEYGITNLDNYFQKVLDEGYLRNANIFEIFNAEYTIPELKIVAGSLGAPKTGKKHQLITQIVAALSPSEIDNMLNNSTLYALSEKGIAILESNADYVELHRYICNVPLSAFNDYRFPPYGTKRRNFYDTMFQFYSAQIAFYEWKHNYSALCLAHLNLYNIMMKEFQKTTHSVPLDLVLLHYVHYLYLHSCFCWETKEFNEFHDYFSFRNIQNFTLPPPGKDLYKLIDFEKYINYDLVFTTNPPSYFSHEEFKQYVHEMINEPIFDKQKWDTIIQCKVTSYLLLLHAQDI